MAELGKGYINVIPKFPGLSSEIQNALSATEGETIGRKWSSSFQQGVGSSLKSGAMMGVFSATTTKALNSITANMDAAIARFDTLNNYPRVMQSLGYTAEQADTSINKMSDRLLGLPTTLNSMVSTVQGLSVITKDLDLATESGLALNDMLLASGSSQQMVTSAAEQFRQMLSKGKPDMQDWKALVQTMPGQLDQLARSMLGSTATTNDLYAALGGGQGNKKGAKAKFTMTDLLNQIIKLDQEGGQGFASFEEQARQATGGVATSMTNLNTAVSRGLAGILDTIGQENIAGVFTDLKNGINDGFGTAKEVIEPMVPLLKDAYEGLKDIAPTAAAAGAGFLAFQAGGSILGGVTTKAKKFVEAAQLAAGGAGTLSESLKVTGAIANPAGVALGLAGVAAGILAMKAYEAYQNQQNLEMATTGLSQAVSNATALGDYSAKIDNIGTTTQKASWNIQDLNQSIADHVRNIQEHTSNAQTEIATLNTYSNVIKECVGNTDMSVEQQGELEYVLKQVNDQFGLGITVADVIAGKYTDQNGKVQDLTSSLDALIDKKKEEIRLDALSSSIKEAEAAEDDAAKTYAQAKKDYDERKAQLDEANSRIQIDHTEYAGIKKAYEDAETALNNQAEAYDTAKKAKEDLYESFSDEKKALSDSANAYDEWGNSLDKRFSAILATNGTTLAALKEDLQTLGADTTRLNNLTQPELEELAFAYKGNAESIIETLDKLHVTTDNKSVESVRNIKKMSETLDRFKRDSNGALDGLDTWDFANKLDEAGFHIEQLSNMGTEQFNALAERCGYDVDYMVAMLSIYNSVDIVDKDGKVTIEETKLIDAQGRVYTWNGSTLLDKNSQAVVNDVKLVDAQGHVVEWNGESLNPLSGSATINSNLKSALADAQAWNSLDLASYTASAVLSVSTSILGGLFDRRAAGGIRLNAEGGYRYHADGAIATKAVPLDIVGEDGAEAIVPLTNRKYSQPFIDLLAEGINDKRESGGNTYVNIRLAVGADSSAKDIVREIAREIKLHGLMK